MLQYGSDHSLLGAETLIAAGLVGTAIIGLMIWIGSRQPVLQRRSIMTKNEAEFDHRLRLAFPHLAVWPQIPFLAILEPAGRPGTPGWQRAFKAVSNRRADWVLAKDGNVVALIELDDKSHDKKADRKRDKLLASCGYRVMRFESTQRPSIEQLRKALTELEQ